MTKIFFPWAASVIGLFLLALLVFAGGLGEQPSAFPLLTLLFMSEFGCLVTAAGGYFAVKHWRANRDGFSMLMIAVLCLLMSLSFLIAGLVLWGRVSA
jgi:hypothetical protein